MKKRQIKRDIKTLDMMTELGILESGTYRIEFKKKQIHITKLQENQHKPLDKIIEDQGLKINNDLTDQIGKLWNELCISLPKIKLPMSEARKKLLVKRLIELPDIETWTQIFYKLDQSDFCSGRSTQWQANFDWLIKNENNCLKVLEGNYDNKTRSKDTSINMHILEELQNGKGRVHSNVSRELSNEVVESPVQNLPRLVRE